MRFLLHPRPINVLERIQVALNSNEVKNPSGTLKSSRYTLIPSSSREHQKSSAGVNSTTPPLPNRLSEEHQQNVTQKFEKVKHQSHRAWGQQCSPHCGCVVRFEAIIQNNIVQAASYHAKRVHCSVVVDDHVTNTPSSATRGTSIHNGQQQQNRSTRRLVAHMTAKGRPMLSPCSCSSLHHLATALVQQMPYQCVPRLKNTLEFHATRSSAAFGHAVLAAQQLPSHDTHCFDVVEEAYTALWKGYMPQPRRKAHASFLDFNTEEWHNPSLQPDYDVDDEAWRLSSAITTTTPKEDFLQFGELWKSNESEGVEKENYDDTTALPRLCTLTMFDINQKAEEQKKQQEARKKLGMMPRDWVSYVDALYVQQERSA